MQLRLAILLKKSPVRRTGLQKETIIGRVSALFGFFQRHRLFLLMSKKCRFA